MVNDSKKVDVEKDIVKVNKLNIDDAFTALTLKYKNLQKKIEKALSAFNVKQQEKRRVLSEEKTKPHVVSQPEKKAKPLPPEDDAAKTEEITVSAEFWIDK